MQWELLLFAGIKREEMIMELKAIFLDIDNTLLDFDAAAQQSMEESFHKFGLSFHPEMMSIFNEENDKIWRRIEKKEISIADLPHVRCQSWAFRQTGKPWRRNSNPAFIPVQFR